MSESIPSSYAHDVSSVRTCLPHETTTTGDSHISKATASYNREDIPQAAPRLSFLSLFSIMSLARAFAYEHFRPTYRVASTTASTHWMSKARRLCECSNHDHPELTDYHEPNHEHHGKGDANELPEPLRLRACSSFYRGRCASLVPTHMVLCRSSPL
jgi:hypothetical protein